jgi:pimeloyl-ACP methyl ester carboxylesterase
MAAEVEAMGVQRESEFPRLLTWRDMLAIALVIPIAAFAIIGYSIGALGALTAALLWGDRLRGRAAAELLVGRDVVHVPEQARWHRAVCA